MAEEGADGGDLKAQIDLLLAMPFEEALASCEALRRYIAAHEDPEGLTREFREHWPEAPAALRQVLEELLDPDLAATNSAAAEAFLEDPRGVALAAAAAPGDAPAQADGAAAGAAAELAGVGAGESPLGRGAAVAALDEDDDLSTRIGRLLDTPLDEAMRGCAELREYIMQRPDAQQVEAEFRDHWGPEAPFQLRELLAELLDPQLASAAVAERDALSSYLAGVVQGPQLPREPAAAEGAKEGAKPGPRSRL